MQPPEVVSMNVRARVRGPFDGGSKSDLVLAKNGLNVKMIRGPGARDGRPEKW